MSVRSGVRRGLSRIMIRGLLLLGAPLRVRLFECSRSIVGARGLFLRQCLVKSLAASCGDNVALLPDVHLLRPHLLRVGTNVSIHPMCYIDASGGVSIGDNVSIAHGVTVMSTSHLFESRALPIREQGYEYAPTSIGNDVWIGAKATILCGVSVGTGAVIGANSVVTRDVEPYTVVAGSPARPIGHR